MRKILVCGMAVVLSFCGLAKDYEFVWRNSYASANNYVFSDENGKKRVELSFLYTNNVMTATGGEKGWWVKHMYVYPDVGGKITFTSASDPLTTILPSPTSTIYLYTNDCKLVFKNVVSNRCIYAQYKGPSASTFRATWNEGKFITADWQLVAPGKLLKDYKPVDVRQEGVKAMLNDSFTMFVEQVVRHGPDRMTFQYQSTTFVDDYNPPLEDVDRSFKVVKMELKQGVDGIYARAQPTTYRVWSTTGESIDHGPDIDTLDIGLRKDPCGLYVGPDSPRGCGITKMDFVRDGVMATVRYEGPTYFGTSLCPLDNTRIEIASFAQATGNIQLSPVSVGSEVAFVDAEGRVATKSAMSYKGDRVFESATPGSATPYLECYEAFAPSEPVVVARGHTLAELVVATNMPISSSYPNDSRPSYVAAGTGAPANTNDFSWAYIAGSVEGGENFPGGTTEGSPDHVRNCYLHPANLFNLKWDSDGKSRTNAVVQFQCQDGTAIRSVHIRLTQIGNDIYASTVTRNPFRYAYITDTRNTAGQIVLPCLGVDFDNLPPGVYYNSVNGHPMAATEAGINVWRLHLVFSKPRVRELELAGSPQNIMEQAAKIIVRGTGEPDGKMALRITDSNQLPASDNVIRVENGGELRLDCTAAADRACTFYVCKGGALRETGAFSSSEKIVLDGGRMWLGYGTPSDVVATYLYDVTLKNGGQIDVWPNDYATRVVPFSCGGGLAKVTVGGDSPSTNNVNVAFYSDKTSASTAEFFVAKTGGGSHGADFVQNGSLAFSYGSVQGGNVDILKTGDGTMLLNGDCLTTNAIVLANGTLKLAKSVRWLSDSSNLSIQLASPLAFEGGCFATADGSTNAVGSINRLTEDSSIEVGENATLSFADSSGAAACWAGGKKLCITAGEGARVRFGTSAKGLASAQVAQLRLNGKRVALDGEGYVCASGLLLIVW